MDLVDESARQRLKNHSISGPTTQKHSQSVVKQRKHEPTLDHKGRINSKMLMQEKLFLQRSSNPDNDKRIEESTHKVCQNYYMKRCPQLCSKSTSPFLMANSFNFDVSDTLMEIKERRWARNTRKYYEGIEFLELRKLAKAKKCNLEPKEEAIMREVFAEKEKHRMLNKGLKTL